MTAIRGLIDGFENAVRIEEQGGFKGIKAHGRRMRVEYARRQLLSELERPPPPNLDHALNELRECLDETRKGTHDMNDDEVNGDVTLPIPTCYMWCGQKWRIK
jgi:hypothetical protein